jgi:hypothetical protein
MGGKEALDRVMRNTVSIPLVLALLGAAFAATPDAMLQAFSAYVMRLGASASRATSAPRMARDADLLPVDTRHRRGETDRAVTPAPASNAATSSGGDPPGERPLAALPRPGLPTPMPGTYSPTLSTALRQ